MNIAVLAGGLSTERDVSLSSASMVLSALKKAGHPSVMVDSFLGLDSLPENIADLFTLHDEPHDTRVGTSAPDLACLQASRTGGQGLVGQNVIEVCNAADLVYMGLHGDAGEDGRMQAFFDALGIRYTGTGYLGSALAMNKWLTKQLLLKSGIPTAKAVYIQKGLPFPQDIPFPCVVKPCSGGSSIGVFKAETLEELQAAALEAFALEDTLLAEEYIPGREFSVGVLGGEALPVIEIIPDREFYDYTAKYQPGLTKEVCPADLPEPVATEMQQAALRVFDTLMLDVYARVDFMLDNAGNPYCLEANTLPGMTPTSLLPQEAAAVGYDYPALCEKIIALSLEKYR
ncbi:MAG: D-alanine--D-alanine ligase family protein [Christensenellaceae bacterium]|jgi:D-alanine-D-alanine ligase